jgi:hypothetical protein
MELPKPMTVAALVATERYFMPDPHVMFQTAEYETPSPVRVVGRHFSVDVALDSLVLKGKKSGLYEFIVYAKGPKGGPRMDPVSARVVRVEP